MARGKTYESESIMFVVSHSEIAAIRINRQAITMPEVSLAGVLL